MRSGTEISWAVKIGNDSKSGHTVMIREETKWIVACLDILESYFF